MAQAPTILDEFGREARLNSSFYPAIASGRERRDMPTIIGDSDRTSNTAYNRLQTLNITRQLVANHGIVRGPIWDMTTYSIGTGLIPQSQVESDKAAAMFEDYFLNFWAPQADYTGEHHFNALQVFASRAIDVDGDIGFYMHSPNPNDIGQLQLVEGHRIGDPITFGGYGGLSRRFDGWQDGVKRDIGGRRIAYRVIDGDDLEGTRRPREVAARDFIFLFDPDRADASRGMSALAHAIEHSRDIKDILYYEKVGVKKDAAVGGVITTLSGNGDAGSTYIQDGFRASDTGGLPWETIQAGMIARLKQGEKYESFGSNRPSPTFVGFLEFLLREIAVGLGLPLEFVWASALAKGNRFVLAKAKRRFAQRQALLVRRFLNRVWFWVIAKAIKRGDLPPVKYWWLVKWQAPEAITMDLGREAQANRDDLKYGNRTLAEDAGERGLHWKDDIRAQRDIETRDLLDRAVALVEKYKAQGLTLDKALYLLSADSPNAPQLEIKATSSGAGE